ncbi:MAG: hypothetical protein DLM52_08325 [Chthoniobacterales bacterium]|nr:MAG: hypothetical protein DLM52_08325 [Chthoniobacterales bacterium]
MDEFGYLSVLLSIIVGLAVAQILIGMRGCMLTRSRVRPFWPVQWWAVIFLLISAQTWWAMFSLRNRHTWDFVAFAVLLAQVIILYLVTGLIYPDFVLEREVNLRTHYFEQRRHFFSLCVAMLLLSICRDLVLNHALPEPLNLAFHLAFIAFAISGILFTSEWYHKLAAVVIAGILVTYVVVLFSRLQ